MGTKRTITVIDLWQELVEMKERLKHLVNVPHLHLKDLERRYGVARATIYRWQKSKLLPRARRITGPLWTLADLELAEASGALPRPVSG